MIFGVGYTILLGHYFDMQTRGNQVCLASLGCSARGLLVITIFLLRLTPEQSPVSFPLGKIIWSKQTL